jgi:hypothetical protein
MPATTEQSTHTSSVNDSPTSPLANETGSDGQLRTSDKYRRAYIPPSNTLRSAHQITSKRPYASQGTGGTTRFPHTSETDVAVGRETTPSNTRSLAQRMAGRSRSHKTSQSGKLKETDEFHKSCNYLFSDLRTSPTQNYWPYRE